MSVELLAAYRMLWARVPKNVSSQLEHAFLTFARKPLADAFLAEVRRRDDPSAANSVDGKQVCPATGVICPVGCPHDTACAAIRAQRDTTIQSGEVVS